MADFFQALHCALFSLMSGYGIELESQIIFQIYCYLKLNPANLNKIKVSKQWSWLPKFVTFVNIYGPSFLRPVVFKVKIGITLQKKTEVSILTANPWRILAVF